VAVTEATNTVISRLPDLERRTAGD
jgi:hypothetical protein